MKKFLTALFLLLTTPLFAATWQERWKEGDGSNGYTIVLFFNSVGGPEPDHAHIFFYPVKWHSLEDCQDAAAEEDGENAAMLTAVLAHTEQEQGYKLKDLKLGCFALPDDAPPSIVWAPNSNKGEDLTL